MSDLKSKPVQVGNVTRFLRELFSRSITLEQSREKIQEAMRTGKVKVIKGILSDKPDKKKPAKVEQHVHVKIRL